MKTCYVCKTSKPEDQFLVNNAKHDGLTVACAECLRARDRERYTRSKGKRLKAMKEYSQTEAGKAAHQRAKKKWTESNIVKRAANVLVGNAIRDGKLTKQSTCSVCGATGRIHGHHDDYSKPLEVRWLCSKCHCAWHKENGAGLHG